MAFNMSLPKMPSNPLGQLRWAFFSVPWEGIKIYGPQFLVAIPAAFASSQWAADLNIFPKPFNYLVGVAFEWIYMGVMAMAGSMVSKKWYYTVILSAGFSSMLYVFLYSAKVYGVTETWNTTNWKIFFAAVHAIPLSGLNILYGLLIHSYRLQEALQESLKEFQCSICGWLPKTPSAKALNGHMKTHSASGNNPAGTP